MNTITRIISEVHEKLRPNDSGAPADYIPELAEVDADLFGIALTTPDGYRHVVGDTDALFTIQSVSKAFVYGLVLDEVGTTATEDRVDLEPSGDAFNEISLNPTTSKPMNAMINAGAIAVTGLVPGSRVDDRFAWLVGRLGEFAGRPLELDEDVYRSESETGHRNRAIAHLLRSGGILGDRVEDDLDLYFRQCSVRVTCEDLAAMGATLAHGGINPSTGQRVISESSVERVLSVMCSSGMYNWSGSWLTQIGLPAKSGVGGGVVAVLPGQLALAVFSPRLDEQGNSVRGIETFRELSRRFNLHLFNTPTLAGQVVRRSYRLSESGSTRRWPITERQLLEQMGASVAVIEVQGDLFFAAVERLSRAINEDAYARTFILDCSRVGLVDPIGGRLLADIALDLERRGCQMIIADPNGRLDHAELGAEARLQFVEQVDVALEGAEYALLRAAGHGTGTGGVGLADCELLAGVDEPGLELVSSLMFEKHFATGAAVCRTGDAADALYVLTEGSLDVSVPSSPSGTGAGRIASLSPGVCVGEVAIVDGQSRSADVIAAEPSTCQVLTADAFGEIERNHPSTYGALVRNILLMNLDRLRQSHSSFTDHRD